MIEFRVLQHALALERHQNFARAAAALNLSQPSLSRSIAGLEQLLGVPLFDRGPKQVVPTVFGRILLERGAELLRGEGELRREIQLLAGLELGTKSPGQLAGLIGIAAAPDFTAWGYSDEQQAELLAGEVVLEENAYGPQPTPTFPAFWADGQSNLLLGKEIDLDCPVRLIQGQADPDVPWHVALQLAEDLRSADVQVHLIKDGDHRLSRPADIAVLLQIVADLCSAT